MKSKALFGLAVLPLLITLIWVMQPEAAKAFYGSGYNPQSSSGDMRLMALANAKATVTPSHPLTPTPLPAVYKVEQYHPGMIIGAGVLVIIIVIGVLAFSFHK